MPGNLKLLICLGMFVIMGLRSHGAHIVGGEMFYTCISDNTYQFTLKIYRDCDAPLAAPFDPFSYFGVYTDAGDLVTVLDVELAEIDEINTNIVSPCATTSPNVCVEVGTYIFELTVPSGDVGYSVVYQRCCRNATVQNLQNPGNQGLSVFSTIPAADDFGCNSSPEFSNFPSPALCVMENLSFDHSATDADGDSLAYSLCSPLLGGAVDDPLPLVPSPPPYNPVAWGPGYSELMPFEANPDLTINPVTGLLTGVPTQLGQFVVGICVEEWRNGVLLSVNTRDFQFNVAPCESVSEAVPGNFNAAEPCVSLTYSFENQSNPAYNFLWDFGDPNSDTDFSTAFSPSYTYSEPGNYEVTLITNPGFFCSDTQVVVLEAFLGPSVQISMSDFNCTDGSEFYDFELGGSYSPDADIVWDLGPNAAPTNVSGPVALGISFDDIGPQEIVVEISDSGCDGSSTLIFEIPEPPVVGIMPQDLFCNGLTYSFESAESENIASLLWDFGVAGTDDDQNNGANPTFAFPSPGNYTVTITGSAPNVCPTTVSEIFEIYPLLDPAISPVPILCFDNHSVDFQLQGAFSETATINWDFGSGSPASSSTTNPSGIVFEAPGTYPVSVMVSENGCVRTSQTSVLLQPNPMAEFTASPLMGCAPLTVNFVNQSVTESSNAIYSWDFGDGNSSAQESAAHVFSEPGVYSVGMVLQNLNGCLGQDAITKASLIEVHPVPRAGFRVEPEVISAVDPAVEVVDQSEGGVSCSYFFDEQIFEACDFSHVLSVLEPQPIIQTVTNEFGCTARATGMIRITDHQIFIPNAFTPDGDGLNDIFIPVSSGVQNLEMQIFDRWGQLVFSSSNVVRGWDGSKAGSNYYAEAGIYHYLIKVTDFIGWTFDYPGTITLVR